jgi:predicted nucleic acid-binding protein
LTSFVVDSSVALAWILPDEHDARADALADALEGAPACVPPLWSLEVTNALVTAQRRKRLTDREAERLFKVLEALPIEFDSASPEHVAPAVFALARKLGLTAYDAAYLELAKRRALPLATLDSALAEGARKVGIPVLP